MGCGTGCLKFLLIMLNVLFWIFGLGLLAIGVWVKVDRQVANLGEAIKIGADGNDQELLDIAAYVFIGGGIFTFMVGFFGCCGAIRESQCLLGFYIVCLVLMFFAEVAIAVIIGMQYTKISDNLTSYGVSWVKTSYDGDSLTSRGFNYVQIEFCCCGFEDFRDYKGSAFLVDNAQVKDDAYMSFACCKPSGSSDSSASSANIQPNDKEACETKALALSRSNDTVIPGSAKTCDSVFRAEGCKDKLIMWVEEHLPIVFGVAAGIAGAQILIFIIAVCMCVQVRRDKE